MSMAEQLSEVMLEAYEEPQDEEQRARFRIQNEDMANWAVQKIAKERAAYREAQAVAEEQTQRIDTWLAGKKAELERAEGFFGGLLAAYYLPVYEESDEHRKTFKLPAGAVQIRKQQPEYVRDDARLLKWLKRNKLRGYIEKVEKPKWGELKKRLRQAGERVVDENGEVVDGVLVVERGLKVNVATDEGEV